MRPPHTCGRREDDNSDCKRAREGQNKKPAGLALGGVQEERGVRYFFAVRLRVEAARGVLTGFEFAALDVVSEPSDVDPTEEASGMASCDAGSVTGRLDAGLSPPRTSAKILAPVNAQAFMASACAPIIRRTAPADSRN